MERKSLSQHARDFDALYKGGAWSRGTPHHRLLLQNSVTLKEDGVKTVLDVGCGRGLVLRDYQKKGFDATGMEISSYVLENDLKRSSVYPLSVEDLGRFEARSFDLVILCQLLEYLRDEEEVRYTIKESARIAALGVYLTLGDIDDFRSYVAGREWWQGLFREMLGEFAMKEVRDSRLGVSFFSFWRTECE